MTALGVPWTAINLQATLSASSALMPQDSPTPHHPITCPSTLRYAEDGSFACEHVTVEAGDLRTGYCVAHSMALLILEEGRKL